MAGSTAQTPPDEDCLKERLNEDLQRDYRSWSRLLAKCNATRIKILCALSDNDCREASEMLGESPRLPAPVRCGHCPGCPNMTSLKACKVCPGCQNNHGCVERGRLCFNWTRSATYLQQGSIGTAISSKFDFALADLSHYRERVDKLTEASINLDLTIAQFPADESYPALHPIYCKERRCKEIQDEEITFSRVESVLASHGEQRERLTEVLDENPRPDPGFPDWINCPSALGTTQALNLLPLPSHWTQSPGQGATDPSQLVKDMPDPALNQADPSGLQALSSGLFSPQPKIQDPSFKTAPGGSAKMPGTVTAPTQNPASSTILGASGIRPIQNPTHGTTLGAIQRSKPRNVHSNAPSPRSRLQSQSDSRPGNTSGTQQGVQTLGETRECLYHVITLVTIRSNALVADLNKLEQALLSTDLRNSVDWANHELQSLHQRLQDLETLEMEAWLLTSRSQGQFARANRVEEWSAWYRGVNTALGKLKTLAWEAHQTIARPRSPH